MSLKINLEITDIFPEQQVSETFKKRVLWGKTDEQYSQPVEIQFVQNNTDLLDNFRAGDKVEIHFGIQGRINEKDGQKRLFQNLNGYGIKKA